MPGLRIFGGVIGADIDIKPICCDSEKGLYQGWFAMGQIAKSTHPFQGEVDGHGMGQAHVTPAECRSAKLGLWNHPQFTRLGADVLGQLFQFGIRELLGDTTHHAVVAAPCGLAFGLVRL